MASIYFHFQNVFQATCGGCLCGTCLVKGHGREWVDNGVIMGRGGEWVKIVNTVQVPVTDDGEDHEELLTLSYRDWQGPYKAIRAALGASFPGYVSHESAEWWEEKQQWVFFPRKISEEGPYSDDADEVMGNTHRYVVASGNFSSVEVRTVSYPVRRLMFLNPHREILRSLRTVLAVVVTGR